MRQRASLLGHVVLAAALVGMVVGVATTAFADDDGYHGDHYGDGDHGWHEHHERPAYYYQPGYYQPGYAYAPPPPPVVYAPPPPQYVPPVDLFFSIGIR